MKMQWIRAFGFGPIDDARLDLGEGLTVISGGNESGKSSWHAALTAALTGRRKGGSRKAKQEFDDRHRPWHGGPWRLGCGLELADGQSVEIVHDFDALSSQAVDAVTGRDLTGDLTVDGAVDACRLIGLDRTTLPLVASVAQNDVLRLALAREGDDEVGALRQFLQQAASSRAQTDATAEQALDSLRRFRRDSVGTDRARTKPLKASAIELDEAQRDLSSAHDAWLAHRVKEDQVRRLEREVAALAVEVDGQRLANALADHQAATTELAQVRELAAQAPAEPAAGSNVAQLDEVQDAISSQLALGPVPQAVDQSRLVELEAELLELPSGPVATLPVDLAMLESAQELRTALQRVDVHAETAPAVHPSFETGGLDAGQLREFARVLQLNVPAEPIGERAAVADLQDRLASQAPLPFGMAAAVVALAALGAVALWPVSPVVSIVVAVVVLVGSAWFARSRVGAVAADPDEVRNAAMQLGALESRWREAHEQRSAVEARLQAGGLPAQAPALLAVAHRLDDRVLNERQLQRWQGEHRQLEEVRDDKVAALNARLLKRGLPTSPEPYVLLDSVNRYEDDCRRSVDAARQVDRRNEVQQQIAATSSAAAAADEARAHHAQATARLFSVATGVGCDPSDDVDQVLSDLRTWVSEQRSAEKRRQTQQRAWDALQARLNGREISDLETHAEACAAVVAAARAELDAGFRGDPKPSVTALAEATARHHQACTELEGVRSAVEEAATKLVDLAEAEERVLRANTANSRLRRLAHLADATTQFLESAQAHVHRDIAPVLGRLLEDRLAVVSAGRYKKAKVDPIDLSVQLQQADGMWRRADHLSHGTAEQVYLLLRAAIAEVVAPDTESCPLILDDVTVHADADRTEALLDVIREIARDRQVILFSQEQAVRHWAERNDVNVIELAPV